MSSQGRWKRGTNHQVFWSDLEPWVEQLYEEFGAYVRVEVVLPPLGLGVRWGVRTEVYKPVVKQQEIGLWSKWELINPEHTAQVEKFVLQHVSQALLELERERDRAERQAPLL